MIDVHSHVIPKIDDGSKTFEESYTMFMEAYEAGFTDIISTSHYIEKYYETDSITRHAWIQAMNKVLKENKVGLKLYCGSEIYITQNLIKLIKDKKASTLVDSRYVLFELPMNNNVRYLNEMIFEIKSIGMIPVIAHPERYLYVQKDPNILIHLIEQGALFQSNYASIIGYYGKDAKKTLNKLLKNDMVHFLGTDCHKPNSIYSKMNEIMLELKKVIDNEKIEKLTLINPRHILKNEEFEIPIPTKIKKGLFHFG